MSDGDSLNMGGTLEFTGNARNLDSFAISGMQSEARIVLAPGTRFALVFDPVMGPPFPTGIDDAIRMHEDHAMRLRRVKAMLTKEAT